MLDGVQVINPQTVYDYRGNLTIIQGNYDIPFDIKRIYYIWNNVGKHPRGGHAHKSLWQAFVAMHGACILAIDNGHRRIDYALNDPAECLIVSPNKWSDISKFSSDCVLLVLASDIYDEKDYIRNYDEYLRYVQHEV